MNVIITGVSGFVGGNVARHLAQNGIHVIGIYFRRIPQIQSEDIELVQVDLADETQYNKLIDKIGNQKIDAILHFAAQMLGNHIEAYLDNTVQSTRQLLRLGEKLHVKTFAVASSIAVYGNTEQFVNEESDRNNLTDYGIAKYVCERLVEDSTIENRIAFRLPRMLGPNIDASCPWLPLLAYRLTHEDKVTYYNADLPYNNMAHCDTLSEFILTLMKREQLGYCLVGLGATQPMTVLQIVERMKEVLGSQAELIEGEPVKRNTCFAIELDKAISLGYHPWTVEETLERFAQEFQ